MAWNAGTTETAATRPGFLGEPKGSPSRTSSRDALTRPHLHAARVALLPREPHVRGLSAARSVGPTDHFSLIGGVGQAVWIPPPTGPAVQPLWKTYVPAG